MDTFTFDASRQPLGRMAARIAVLLMGKHRPGFQRERLEPVQIVVTESDRLLLSGKKAETKLYHRHSGYLGHLKTITARELGRRDSRLIVRYAVRGMLPKNKLRAQMLKRLTVYRKTPEADRRSV